MRVAASGASRCRREAAIAAGRTPEISGHSRCDRSKHRLGRRRPFRPPGGEQECERDHEEQRGPEVSLPAGRPGIDRRVNAPCSSSGPHVVPTRRPPRGGVQRRTAAGIVRDVRPRWTIERFAGCHETGHSRPNQSSTGHDEQRRQPSSPLAEASHDRSLSANRLRDESPLSSAVLALDKQAGRGQVSRRMLRVVSTPVHLISTRRR